MPRNHRRPTVLSPRRRAITAQSVTGDVFTGELLLAPVTRDVTDAVYAARAEPTTGRIAQRARARRDIGPLQMPSLLAFAVANAAGVIVATVLVPMHAWSLGASNAMVGVLTAAFAAAQVVSSLALGVASDRLGRTRVLTASLIVSAAAMLLLPATSSVTTLFVARVLHGLGAGATGVAMAALTEITESTRRTRVLGWFGAATSLGAVIGPTVLLAAEALGRAPVPAASFAICTILLLGLLALHQRTGAPTAGAYAFLPHGVPSNGEATQHAAMPTSESRASAYGSRSRLLVVQGFAIAAASGIPSMLPVVLTRESQDGAALAARLMLLLGVLGLPLRAVAAGAIAQRLGARRTVRIGCMLIAIGVGVLTTASPPWMLSLATVPLALGTAATFPALGALVADATRAADRGAAFGRQQAIGALARTVAPVLLGLAAGRPLLSVAVAAVLFALLLSAWWALRPHPHAPPTSPIRRAVPVHVGSRP